MARRRSIIFQNSIANKEDVEQPEVEFEFTSEEVKEYINKVDTETEEWKKICLKIKKDKEIPFVVIEPSKFDFKSHLTKEELNYLNEIEEFGNDDINESKAILKRLEMVEKIYQRQSKTVETLFRSYRNVIDMCQAKMIEKMDPKYVDYRSVSEPGNIEDDSFLS